jgi:Ca2+-binding EF-hand superfamily protein
VDDYQKAFGSKPPSRARIAIMNDSDNTGESSISFMEYLEVSR